MKKVFHSFLVIAALSFAACNSNGDRSDKTSDNGQPGQPDSSTTATTTTVDKSDADFLSEAAYGGMKEVADGKNAQQKGMAKEIKDLGAMMVTDHSAMGEKIKALAAKKNINIPDSLSRDDMDKMQKENKSGADFDKSYANEMVDDHEKDIKMFEDEANNGKDPDIKALAAEALPKLRHHLEMAKAAKAKVKG